MIANSEQCGCGAVLPAVGSPGHPYMGSTPSCWQAYNQLIIQTMGLELAHVDAYAAQHFYGSERDRRQRKSVAVHLTAICLGLEHGFHRLDTIRPRLSRLILPKLGLSDWPLLQQPSGMASVTVVSLTENTITNFDDEVYKWRLSVWELWEFEHARVREWATVAKDSS